jgi:hypothetical protein
MGTIRALICVLLGGHWRVFHLDGRRLCLKCVQCQSETPGWQWTK